MSSRTDQIVEYVGFVVDSLVDDPEAVKVTPSWEDDELFVDIEVADNERGRIIGKQGRLIRSLRVIIRAAAGRDGTKATVELLEPEEGEVHVAGPTASDGDAAPADDGAPQ